jgi:predicted SAM-dependent methyltransferase
VNIDINPRNHPDLWLDIRSGLPFPPASVAFIYTSHTLEHLPLAHVTGVLRECRRVLEPGGWLRIVVPDLLKAIKAYVEHNEEWFLDWPHSFRSVGGRFTNYLFCDSQHKCAFDLDLMSELLSGAGFATIVSACGGQSRVGQQYPCELARIEEEDERSLFLEARKP